MIDEAALIDALESGKIRGAGLDVFTTEPVPAGHPFYRLKNALLSPHCADRTPGWLDRAIECFLDNFERFRKGEPLLNVVDKHAGYRSKLRHIQAAAERIRSIAQRTPVMTSRSFNQEAGITAFFKCENFQKGGAFKIRGAANFIFSIPKADLPRGVVAYSSGNHAQAVAIAANALGIPATVVMPEDAPRTKVEATRAQGAYIVTYNRLTEDRSAISARIAGETADGRTALRSSVDDRRTRHDRDRTARRGSGSGCAGSLHRRRWAARGMLDRGETHAPSNQNVRSRAG